MSSSLSPARSPGRRARGKLPNLKSTASPYRKAAAEGLRGSNSSWKSVALPDIPGPSGPAEGPLSPDPMFQARESKALTTWMQSAQNGDAEAQNNLGVSYYRGINGVQKVTHPPSLFTDPNFTEPPLAGCRGSPHTAATSHHVLTSHVPTGQKSGGSYPGHNCQ